MVRQRLGRVDLVLAAVLVLGTVLRFWGLGSQSLWYDEWLSVEATSGSIGDLFRHVANREGMPPTYFLVLWRWRVGFGDSALSLRFLSAVAGTATIPVVYAAVRELGLRRPIARVAGLVVAVHPMLIWYSQEARPYSILTLFGAASLWTFARVWRGGERRDLIAWGLACAGAIAFHYFAAFLVVAEAGALLVTRRRPWRELTLAGAPSAVVLAALAPILKIQDSKSGTRQWITDFALIDRVREARGSILVGPSPPDDGLWVIVALVVGMAAVLVVVRSDREERGVAALTAAIGAVAIVLPLVAAPIGLDAVVSRYLIAAVIPLVVAVAIGLSARAFGVGLVAVAVVVAVSLGTNLAVARDPELQRPDWEAVANAFDDGHGDRVLVVNLYGLIASPLLHYSDETRGVLTDDNTLTVDEIDVVVAKPSDKPCNFLVGRTCALVFLGAPPPEPLASQLTLEGSIELDQFRIDRYRTDSPLEVSRADLVTDPSDALVLFAPG